MEQKSDVKEKKKEKQEKSVVQKVSEHFGSDNDETSDDDETRSTQEQYVKSDPALDFFTQPHTISFLFTMLLFGLYIALNHTDTTSWEVNSKWGLSAVTIVFILMGTVLLKNGPFTRPHPAVWRAVLAVTILYELFLVYLLFMRLDDARLLFRHVNPNLGVPLPEKSYAEACDFTWENLRGGVDEFVIAHALGWWAKTLILRDVWMAWILSVCFEFLEYSLEHQLPNFAECWWDHWLLDVLICNWLGIYLGMKTLRYLETKTYDWRGWSKITRKRDKARRAIEQFTPASWTVFEWGATKNFKRWVVVIFLMAVFLQSDLNSFYLKYLLWFPPTEPLNTYRLTIHFAMGMVGFHEAYRLITDSKCKRLGSQGWCALAIVQTETLLCIKWGKDKFPNPAPPHVIGSWAVFVSLLVLFTIVRFSPIKKYFFPNRSWESKSKEKEN